MKRLRHPIRAIREPFGTAGLIVAMIALVAALGGTALAASKLNSTQKKEVEKIAKKFAGKPGAAGTNGSNGPQGAKGDAGAAGSNGAPGAAGKSVVIGTATAGECAGSNPTGGTTVEVEGSGTKKKVCNGKEGSPWTAGGTLPSGKTETGTWSVDYTAAAAGEEEIVASFSFPIPLAKAATPELVTASTEGCPGTFAAPKAQPGHFCAYVFSNSMQLSGFRNLEELVGPSSTSRFGALALFETTAAGKQEAMGSWAVTAE